MAFTSGYKVNEGTDYEFTVSNETISEMAQASDTGITEADIAAYCYSALIDSRIETVKAESHTDTYQSDWHSWCQDNAMFYYIDGTRYINSNTNINNTSDTVYERNFLVWYGTIYPGEPEQKTGWFLIMDIKDIKNFYVDFSDAGFSKSSVASTSTEDDVTTPFKGYTGDAYLYQSDLENVYPNIYQADDTITTIHVVNVLNINDELWIGRLNPSNYGEQTVGETKYGYVSYTPNNFYNKGWLTTSDIDHFFQTGSTNWSGIPKIYDMEYPDLGFNVAPSIESYAESDDMLIRVNAEHYGGFDVASVAVIGTKTLNGILTWMSWCGLKFQYQDTMYKPIISGGVIVGYSDDMDAESEYDDMTNVTGNNISPTPPGPTPPSPGDDDPWDGVDFGGISSGGGAFAKFYYMTSAELANLRTWMNSNNVPEGFDPMAQIIGLSQMPVAINAVDAATVIFSNPSAIYKDGENRAVDSGIATQRGIGATQIYPLGSVEIPRRMQQRGEPYLDYSCAIELYLPFCGVFTLDTQAVMGRTISAELVLDPTTGSIIGYAWVENNGQKLPVAYGSGQVGIDLPITSQQYSMSKAALAQANANLSQSVLQTAFQALFYAGTKGAAAAENAGDAAYIRTGRPGAVRAAEKGALGKEVGTYVKSQASSNLVGSFMDWGRALKEISYGNNTAVSGSFGGSYASWSNPFTAYVKIIRPKFQKPSNYNHTQAVPCVEAKTVGSCSGLIQCIGVDTSSITNATSIERDAIAAALANGVYAGGGN